MQRAEQLFLKTLERCSYFHADCHYYIGVINYSMGNQTDAIRSFEAFLAFDHKDIERYHPQHMARKADVKVVLQKMKDERSILENAVPFSPKIVENVSTNNDEYFPMLSPDNEIMFYTRKSDKRLKGDLVSKIVEEFTMSHRASMHGVFDGGKPVDSPFNDGTFNSYGAATLSVDNKEMIVSACKDENVRGQIYRNCDLYVTYFEIENGKYKWSSLKNLGDGINTVDGWEAQPTLSADGNTLYYTAMRPTTRDNDIFVSERLPDGSWGASKPFDEINTAGKDKSPFFHQDSETFYFVSSVSSERKGVGGTDIFYMRKQPDGRWSKPKNIGYPINTEGDEIGLFVSTDGKEAYFSSLQKGVWNIYSFELYEEARPQSVVVVKGELKDENGEPVVDAEIEIAYSKSDKIEKVKINGNDGKYAAIVKTKEPQDVMVSIKKEGHAFDSKIIEKEVLAKGETIRAKDMEVRKIEKGKPYTINDILYATASAELNDRSRFILKQFARFLETNPELKITIQGHTDNEGDAEKNMTLSQRRAEGVKSYLISLGVGEERLNAKGFGQTSPKVPNTSSVNKAKNRRTDFVIE
ncbi:MAG: OmpA family protein [Crocinitomicaceae bacterium]|nr:OmpA family protein [Crocinitomicaceae bacterium]